MGNQLGKLVSPGSPDALTPGTPVALFESDPVTLSSADILAGTAVEIVPAPEGKVLIPVLLVAHTHPGNNGYEGSVNAVVANTSSFAINPAPEFEYALSTTDEWETVDGSPPQINGGAQMPATMEGPLTITIGGATAGDGSATLVVVYYAIDIP